MSEVVIIAGPNGAGKTTFANKYLSERRPPLDFVNADEIARELSGGGFPERQVDTRAARIIIQRINVLVDSGVNFMFETTLATLTYARKIPIWQRSGYIVSLMYLRLPSKEASIARVRRRVEAGGHGIPEEIIRRRFDKSCSYLEDVYKPIVNEWYVWDSLEGAFTEAEQWDKT